MKQTEYCGLNQWELSDRIRMEDFNADNAKIAAELAELRRQVLELTYHVGQLCIAESLTQGAFLTQRLFRYECFIDPTTVSITGDISLNNNQALLTGDYGTVSVTIRSASGAPLKTIHVWFHHLGESVVPKLNGEPLTLLYRHQDITALGQYGYLQAYVWTGPEIDSGTLTFEITRPEGTTGGTVLHDFCAAYL